MTLREDLEKEIQEAKWSEHYDHDSGSAAFLRDYGPALLEALRDVERYDWIYRNWILVTKARGTFGEFELPHGAASIDLNRAIDAVKGEK